MADSQTNQGPKAHPTDIKVNKKPVTMPDNKADGAEIKKEAIAEMQKSVAESHRSIVELMYLGHALGFSGARAEGHKVLEEMQSLSRRRYVPPEYFAIVYEGLGERDGALQWFEKACAEHSINVWMLPDPGLDSIRSEPRFQGIMRRMGLPQ